MLRRNRPPDKLSEAGRLIITTSFSYGVSTGCWDGGLDEALGLAVG